MRYSPCLQAIHREIVHIERDEAFGCLLHAANNELSAFCYPAKANSVIRGSTVIHLSRYMNVPLTRSNHLNCQLAKKSVETWSRYACSGSTRAFRGRLRAEGGKKAYTLSQGNADYMIYFRYLQSLCRAAGEQGASDDVEPE